MNWLEKHRIGAKLLMYSGWVLFTYAVTHLSNHALGIFGLDVLETGRKIFIGFWRLPVLEWLVLFALVVHVLAVLYKLFTKASYRGMTSGEWWQLILGFVLLDLMVYHVMETKISSLKFGSLDTYTHYLFWTPAYYKLIFTLLIISVWVHGCIGIYSYIKQKTWYPKWRDWLFGSAVALPIFAIWGIMRAIYEVNILSQDQAWVDTMLSESNPGGVDINAWIESWQFQFSGSYLAFLALFFLTRKVVREVRKKRRGVVIRYLEGTVVSISRGMSLLEASIQARIPHAHVCGGRGRCSTCRVEVIEGLELLPPPSDDEAELLKKIRGGSAVRLACRTRPVAGCTIYPMLLPNVTLKQTLWKRSNNTGIDKDVAVLFTDLRGFTSMAEDKLPYDVVFVLNQYFQFMGHAVEAHHGRIDKFIGDAIMAVFGIDRNLKDACRDALAAARSMRFQLERLNAQLKNELTAPLQMGFGIHCGHVIIGEMGYKDFSNLVAIGDATNTASRLEGLTKEYNCELIVSKETIDNAHLHFNNYERHLVDIRGRQKPMEVYAVKEVRDIEI